MTIATTSNKAIWQGDGSTTVFGFSFMLPSASYAQVFYTDADGVISELSSSQYSLTGINDPNGGTITYPLAGDPIASGTSLTLVRVVPYKQLTDLKNQSGYYPEVVEGALDYNEMEIQQLAEEAGRSLQFPAVDESPDPVLPAAAVRANKYAGYDGAGNPTVYDPAEGLVTSAANVNFLPAGVGSVSRSVQAKLRDVVSPEDFGAVGNGINDDTDAIIAALATEKTVACAPSKNYVLTKGITVNLGKQSFFGNGSTLDFSALSGADIAITLDNDSGLLPGDLGSPFASVNSMEGFLILGDPTGSGEAYAYTTTGVKIYVPHVTLRNCLIYGFGYGINIFTEGYVPQFDSIYVGQCGYGVRIQSGGSNYGERLSFVNSNIYDNNVGIMNACATGAVQLTNCSIDYNEKTFELDNSSVTELHNCWWECNDAGAGNVVAELTNAAQLTVVGGRIQQNGSVGALAQDGFLETSVNSRATFRDVFIFNTKNTANIFDAGSGMVEIEKTKSYAVSYLPTKIAALANNRLFDGGMELASVPDLWYINSDTAGITSRLTGTNITLARSNTYAHSGTYSLQIVKTSGAANGGFALVVHGKPGSRMAFCGWWKKPVSAGAGEVFVVSGPARIDGLDQYGGAVILASETFDTQAICGTTAAVDWTKIETGMDRILPQWANAFMIGFNGFAYAGDLYLDDFYVAEM